MTTPDLIHSIAQEARRYAAFYPASSDGRNTFEMFAEFVETRAIAQVGTHPKGGDSLEAPAPLSDAVAEGHAPEGWQP